ncbi:Fic family protein [archaeon]|jgi:Fic family protein|nr:Fic family protein [archaeon]MBT6995415.1 Fic family protein [Candidatus Woesearchaeota archaeon]
MSSIEKVNNKSGNYLKFIKKATFMGKKFVYKEHIGKDTKAITKEKYLLENLDKITKEELKFKLSFLKSINNELSYDEKLPKEIEEKTIRINNIKEIKKYPESVDTDFAIKFIFNSNNIEGSKIPEEVVKKIIETGNLNYKNKNEAREALNAIDAFGYLKDFNFNFASIKRLYYISTNNLLMENGNSYPKGFKKVSLIVGDSPTTSPKDVEKELKELINWYKKNKGKVHPLILAYDFHLRYESIHPFRDGNGRTGRLILNKILIQNGYPPLIVYKENKDKYFNAIKQAREGRRKKYYQFMLEQTNKSYDFILDLLKRY